MNIFDSVIHFDSQKELIGNIKASAVTKYKKLTWKLANFAIILISKYNLRVAMMCKYGVNDPYINNVYKNSFVRSQRKVLINI